MSDFEKNALPHVSVVVPVFNEESCLQSVLEEMTDALDKGLDLTIKEYV